MKGVVSLSCLLLGIISNILLVNIILGYTAISSLPRELGGGFYVENFGAKGDGVSDDSGAIQKAINASTNSTRVILTGGRTYAIKNQIHIPSARHVVLEGQGGAAIIKWIGPKLDPVKQDNASGAMVVFLGLDHAWSGIRNVFLDANSRAVHCVYLAGFVNTGFVYERINHARPLLDGLKYDVAGTRGPVQFNIINCTAFPVVAFNGKKAVAGRAVFHFVINSSIGQVRILGGSFDNGAMAGLVLWETKRWADTDLIIDGVHWETWMDKGSFVVTRHERAGPMGTISLVRCKMHVSQGSFGALVRNLSQADIRMGIEVQNFRSRDAFLFLFEDVYHPKHNVLYRLKYLRRSFWINVTGGLGPVGGGV